MPSLAGVGPCFDFLRHLDVTFSLIRAKIARCQLCAAILPLAAAPWCMGVGRRVTCTALIVLTTAAFHVRPRFAGAVAGTLPQPWRDFNSVVRSGKTPTARSRPK